ncbi:glutathione peroxidase [Sphingobacterium paludis]|uniref:Glutathione peroxidase n=1 Tax=Sphingobacterium paludis TaxID=1476465 RepID=A0A4R7DBQ8_9SPHI|nr:glutathione peroxidase [Sphingobacterium paludis]TDS17605.1 glutathione peroxidase [Sphingobacterium paludis]
MKEALSSSFYDFSAKSPAGKEIAMRDFEGKVVLIVNTATKCGLAPQFEGLEALYQQYKDQGLVVLGFPCDQFAGQEPETNAAMEETCKVNHGVTFRLTEKCAVNGEHTHPVFNYLKGKLPGILGNRIKWNFTKFLVDRHGKPVKRFAPITKPAKLEKDIVDLLNK